MLAVGLTGGIGSGKSTVAAFMAARGAVTVDADQLAHQVMAPGGEAYAGVVERFGPEILGSDRSVDRAALAGVVFADPSALADLNALTHPAVGRAMAARVAAEAASDHVVVLEVPLLVEAGKGDRAWAGLCTLAAVIVVDTPDEVAVGRLVSRRGMGEADARARLAAQVSREERRARADLVIDNSGSLAELGAEVERAWAWLMPLARASAATGGC